MGLKYYDNYNEPETVNAENAPEYLHRKTRNLMPIEGETLKLYVQRMGEIVREAENVNCASHIYPPRGKPWYTHKQPHCFMCHDVNVYNVLWDVLAVLEASNKYKTCRFSHDAKGNVCLSSANRT